MGEESSERHLQKREKKRAEYGEGNRSQQNDERIAETVELCGQHQKDKDDGEPEDESELASLGAELARFTGVIEHVARRQNIVRFLLQKFQRGIERNRRHTTNRHRVQLLLPIQ